MMAIAEAKKFWDSPAVATMADEWKSDPDKSRHEKLIADIIGGVGTVADIGCGVGRFSKVVRAKHYTGFDGSSEMIRLAKEANPDKDFANVDIMNFQPDEKYDVVIMIDVAQHQVDPFQAIERAINLWKCERFMCTVVVGEIREELLMTTIEPFRNFVRFLDDYQPEVYAVEKCLDGDFIWVLMEV